MDINEHEKLSNITFGHKERALQLLSHDTDQNI
jgi:hypothetical protein